MNPYLAGAIGGVLAYFVGSIPFGKWIAAARGVDILKEGSGNIGATNVWRTLGPKFGFIVLLLDTFKGFAPSYFLPAIAGAGFGNPNWGILFGALAVIGHSVSPFLGFKGGKSVATALGVMLAITPAVAGISFGIFLLFLFLTSYVSVGSMLGATAAPVLAGVFGFPKVVVIVYSILAALIVYRHRNNIRRLIAREEPKFKFRRDRSEAELPEVPAEHDKDA